MSLAFVLDEKSLQGQAKLLSAKKNLFLAKKNHCWPKLHRCDLNIMHLTQHYIRNLCKESKKAALLLLLPAACLLPSALESLAQRWGNIWRVLGWIARMRFILKSYSRGRFPRQKPRRRQQGRNFLKTFGVPYFFLTPISEENLAILVDFSVFKNNKWIVGSTQVSEF